MRPAPILSISCAAIPTRRRSTVSAAKVAGFTGLDPALVRKLGGRIDTRTFTRERDRAAGRVASAYDALVTGYDPQPHVARGDYADPVLDALKTPLASAISDITANQLKWFVDARYEILNEKVSEDWDWGHGTRRGHGRS